jgi:hypothetical protein
MKEVIKAFDKYLKKHNVTFEAVVIGGAALIVLDITDRSTKDIDCLIPKIPSHVKKLSGKFAEIYSKNNSYLQTNWLNNGPIDLQNDLPKGWKKRLRNLWSGDNLDLKTLSQSDLLLVKLYAYCDRQIDLADCIALSPKIKDLTAAYGWLTERDANPDWPKHVENSLKVLARKLGYEFEL